MYKCEICGREFDTERGLKIHMRKHRKAGEDAWREELAQLAAIVKQQAAQIETMKAERAEPVKLTPAQEEERVAAMKQYSESKQHEAVNALKNAPKVSFTAGDKPVSKSLNGCVVYIPAGETALIPKPIYDLIMMDAQLTKRAQEMTAYFVKVSDDRSGNETFQALNAAIKSVM